MKKSHNEARQRLYSWNITCSQLIIKRLYSKNVMLLFLRRPWYLFIIIFRNSLCITEDKTQSFTFVFFAIVKPPKNIYLLSIPFFFFLKTFFCILSLPYCVWHHVYVWFPVGSILEVALINQSVEWRHPSCIDAVTVLTLVHRRLFTVFITFNWLFFSPHFFIKV